MNSSTPKAKFFPPIKTAASFLRSICKSPDVFTCRSPLGSPSSRFFEQKDSRHSTHVLKESGVFIERSNSNLISKHSQFSQFSFKTPQTTSKSFKNFLLPTSIDKLKSLSKAVKQLEHKSSGKKNGQRLEDFQETSFHHFQELSTTNSKVLSDQQFREWFEYMKVHFFDVFENNLDSGEVSFDEFKITTHIAKQEFFRILAVMNNKIAAVFKEICRYLKIVSKLKCEKQFREEVEKNERMMKKIEDFQERFKKQEEKNKELVDSMQSEISLLKSNLILKDLELMKVFEDLKRLKANRTFRIKRDLERFNQLLQEFSEYKELVLQEVKNPCLIRSFSDKSDSIKDLILSRLGLLNDKKALQGSRLSEDQLIEHEMLSTSAESIFSDIAIQAKLGPSCVDFSSQKTPKTRNQEAATDELLDIVEELEVEAEQELFKQPSITIINENQEQIMKSDFPRISDIPVIEEHEETLRSKKRRVSSMYRWRESESKESQTDEKVFLEVAKKEEEEILDWMINDRKNYLNSIQKQIIFKKNELVKVKSLVSQGKNMLLSSSQCDISRQNSLLSSEDSEDFLESEINYLKTVGIIDGETEIESWKHGYIYGYGKAKSDISLVDFSARDKGDGFADEQPELENPRKSAAKPSFIRQNSKSSKKSTKIQEFSFQSKPSKDLKNLLRQQTNNLKFRYIDEFNSESSKLILKQAKMSKKMTLKSISSIYASALQKHTFGEQADLSSFVYDDFFARYGHKIVTKKLIDFLSSVLKYPDNRRTINFAKMIGIGKKIGLTDYVRPRETFTFYLNLLTLLQKSNLGIVFNLEETSDYEFIPAIRAVECSKEILSKYLDSHKISVIINMIESNSHPDPKKINKFGIIDQEYFTEMLLIEIDKHFQDVLNNIWTVFEAFYMSRNIFKVFRQDFIMIVRFLSPDRLGILNDELKKVTDESSEKTLQMSLVIDLCFSLNLITFKDLSCFLPQDYEKNEILNEIERKKDLIWMQFVEFFEKKDRFELDDHYAAEWKSRFEWISENKGENLKELQILWKILNKEIERLSHLR